jgi:isoaspartyl peptidase/L-asparaginase-like protein (Ntn-hydrolase superfamily)
MEGTGRRAGAVAAVRGVRNPVLAARAVMEEGRELLLVGGAAVDFARSAGLELCPEEWFLAGDEAERTTAGTVGAVARDRDGRLAAATSTGGKAGQRAGRVGDTPVIGAGTWADDATAAISCTGDGEASIRSALAHEVHALIQHAGRSLEEACAAALALLARHGGDGGLVAVSASGEVAAPFTSPAMTHAWRVGDGPLHTGVVPEDG